VHAKQTIPHYTYVDELDVTDLVKVPTACARPTRRRDSRSRICRSIVKAVVGALKEVPLVNASLDDVAGEIVLHDKYHIGFAVATPAGLLVRCCTMRTAPASWTGAGHRPTDQRGTRRQIETRRPARRHLHDHVHRQHRRPVRHAHHQPSEVGILGIAESASGRFCDANGQVRAADNDLPVIFPSITAFWMGRSARRSATR